VTFGSAADGIFLGSVEFICRFELFFETRGEKRKGNPFLYISCRVFDGFIDLMMSDVQKRSIREFANFRWAVVL
jgi:hypothetical protein